MRVVQPPPISRATWEREVTSWASTEAAPKSLLQPSCGCMRRPMLLHPPLFLCCSLLRLRPQFPRKAPKLRLWRISRCLRRGPERVPSRFGPLSRTQMTSDLPLTPRLDFGLLRWWIVGLLMPFVLQSMTLSGLLLLWRVKGPLPCVSLLPVSCSCHRGPMLKPLCLWVSFGLDCHSVSLDHSVRPNLSVEG